MITVDVDKEELQFLLREELRKKLAELEHSHTFWDSKELRRRTCMSWNTIQQTFFHDDRFPKAKVGGKWLFPAKEAENFLLTWLKEQSKI